MRANGRRWAIPFGAGARPAPLPTPLTCVTLVRQKQRVPVHVDVSSWVRLHAPGSCPYSVWRTGAWLNRRL